MEKVKQEKLNKWENLFEEFLDLTEFSLEYRKKINEDYPDRHWGLYDRQGANLGNIQGDRFLSAEEIIDRMDIYIHDYIYRDLDEEAEAYEANLPSEEFLVYKYGKEILWSEASYWLAIRQELGENDKFIQDHVYEFDTIDMIVNHTDKIDLMKIYHEEVEE